MIFCFVLETTAVVVMNIDVGSSMVVVARSVLTIGDGVSRIVVVASTVSFGVCSDTTVVVRIRVDVSGIPEIITAGSVNMVVEAGCVMTCNTVVVTGVAAFEAASPLTWTTE